MVAIGAFGDYVQTKVDLAGRKGNQSSIACLAFR
jgi:hypothetical protein